MLLAAMAASRFRKPIVTGGTLYSDSTYYYRAFTTSGTISVTNADLTADVLIIAGGGGATTILAGGAGGLRYFSGLTLAKNGTYTCTVGAGGAGAIGTGSPSQGSKGSNTSFIGGLISYTTTGGGGSNTAGGSGGAGQAGNQGGYTPVEGYGGNGGSVYQYSGGGAGGASYGGSVSPGQTTYPGPGVSTYSAWGAATGLGQNVGGTYWFAGGGGAGSDVYQGINGAGNANGAGTGGRGGGGKGGDRDAAGNYYYGASGQNGVVIVRYLKSAVS